MRKFFTLCSIFVFAMSLAACNTAEGVGEDMEDAGDEIGDAMD